MSSLGRSLPLWKISKTIKLFEAAVIADCDARRAVERNTGEAKSCLFVGGSAPMERRKRS
jgi:hypothetical protein